MTVLRGEKFMATSNDYLYFAAGYATSDIALAKIKLDDGLVGGNCTQPLDLVVTEQPFNPVLYPVTLVQYPSPIVQNPRNVAPQPRNLDPEDICNQSCNQEICTNGIDDDGDGLFDCLDADCDCNTCDGQQARFWYFGDGAGLDFSTDPPAVLTDGVTFSREASSVATDILGNLLFYTDAQTLYNRNHQPMPNGGNLDGHASSTQTLILPEPGNPGRFYVFTPNSFDNLFTGKGLSYSVVEMSLQGGFGDVPAGEKNINLLPQNLFTEKITATRHCNGKDWWILVKERGNNRFRAYPLTAAGLGAEVTTDIGTPGSTASPNTIGCLKFSPNGKKVVNTLFQTGGFEIFDFDNNTGQLANAVTVSAPLLSGAYGTEFSPDGKLLYLTNLIAPSCIRQFDLAAGDGAAILASAEILAEFPDQYRFGQLQRAPNNKIYVTNTFPLQFTAGLGVIHKPNVAGPGSQYQQGGVILSPGGANLGLPSFPQDFLPQSLQADISGPDTVCQLPAVVVFQLGIDDLCALDSVQWSLNGSGIIVARSNNQIEVAFSQPGTATLIAAAYSECSTGVDTLTVHLVDNQPPALDLGPDIFVCDNGVIVLSAGPGFQKYRWNDGSADSTLTAFLPGKYWVDTWDVCGNKQSDTVLISVLPLTALNLGPDPLVCLGTSVAFTRPDLFDSWRWLPSAGLDCDTCKTVIATVTAQVTYIVIAQTGEGCLSADTITLQVTTDTIFASLDTAVCTNESLFILGHELGADTTVLIHIVTTGGCDSIITVTVTGLEPVLEVVELFVCRGDTLAVQGVPVSADTLLQLTYTAGNGCDSVVQVLVRVLDTVLTQLVLAACPGESAVYNGVEVAAGTTQAFQFPGGPGGCDSTVVVQVVSFPAPIVQLPGIDTIVLGDSILLAPAFSGIAPFTWQWTPLPLPDWLSCYDCPSPWADPLGTLSFQVSITDANGCTAADSSAIVVLPCGQPYVPNIFSPNDDGLNDRFYLLGPDCISKVRYLRIYDRWGELLFERTDFPLNTESLGWDGRYRGKDLGPSVLVWVAEFEFPDGTTITKYGDVTLMR
ncbi:MAG: gliding motility-associated C-terminal domain-containing protein [Lewinellaceae bacterium]|nr:gliding motility-associated C-terminal domain-containing protein [Lewinellaceae bacterium]